ncbi:MAG: asparagine--tRNA ligase [Nitrososphaerales archaeon]|nr:asparagine--tRNA ligase [Nitrososphaerales archaeon]
MNNLSGETNWLNVRTHSVLEAVKSGREDYVRLLGWVASKRAIGGIVFVMLRDGSGFIQVAGKKGVTDEESLEVMKRVSLESAAMVGGPIREDERAPHGRELSVKEFKIISLADKWPITKSAIKSPSFLYDNRHLSIRGRKAISILKIRAESIYSSLEFFTKRGFTLINAPMLVQSACEGGATLFNLDYFGKVAFLTQSAQLYEEAAICAFEKVFVLQPAFRAERSKTTKHLTEFWMLEAEQAFATHSDVMKLEEDLVSHMTNHIVDECSEELKTIGRRFSPPTTPFPRITYDEARNTARRKGIVFEWGDDIPTEAEKVLSRSFDRPFFITGYPLKARSFYHMADPKDGRISLSSDLMAPEGYGEIATGGQRIHEYDTLLERVKKQDLPIESFSWYLDLRRYGLPPHSGFGIGIERLVRWICGLRHIRASTLFPRTITRISP